MSGMNQWTINQYYGYCYCLFMHARGDPGKDSKSVDAESQILNRYLKICHKLFSL